MIELGMACDGGKDSVSMVASVDNERVKCPGNLVISVYAPCRDITKTVTPDLKPVDDSSLLYVSMGSSEIYSHSLGGSAVAQCYGQLGDTI